MVVKPGSIDATNYEITYTICNCAMNPFYEHRVLELEVGHTQMKQ